MDQYKICETWEFSEFMFVIIQIVPKCNVNINGENSLV